MMIPLEGDFRLDHEADTARLGAALAAVLRAGDAVLLYGDLGAGKSTLARGLVRALTRADEEVPSPTFTLVQTYEGQTSESRPLTIAHFDLYRLKDASEARELGVDEALDEGCAVIEWPERLEHHLPADRLDVELHIDGEARRARLVPHGSFEGRAFAF